MYFHIERMLEKSQFLLLQCCHHLMYRITSLEEQTIQIVIENTKNAFLLPLDWI